MSGSGTERLTSEAFVVAIKVIFLFSGNKTDRDGILLELLPAAASSALLASSKPKLRLPAVFLPCPQPFPSSSRVAISLTQRGSL